MSSTLNIHVDDLWRYSIALYSNEAVSTLCLRLQDEFDVNVNMLLLSSYLDSCKCFLEVDGWQKLAGSINKINNSLKSLRYARNQLKDVSLTAYDKVLMVELELEKQTQEVLVEKLSELPVLADSEKSNVMAFLKSKNIAVTEQLTHQLTPLYSNMN